MPNFDAINDAMNQPEEIEVTIVRLGGVDTKKVAPNMTVANFKERFGLEGKKLVDGDGNILDNRDTLADGIEIYVSTPKENGK